MSQPSDEREPAAESAEQVTVFLRRMRDGDPNAVAQMLPLVYQDLRRLARGLLRGDRPDHTLQPTALVHEAWLKIAGAMDRGASVDDRGHFLRVAARAMRQVLVNHARDRRAAKRGGDAAKLPLDEVVGQIEARTGELGAWNDLLEQLAAEHPRPAQIVELRVFGGMSLDETAEALGTTVHAAKTDWRFARAWLQQHAGDALE
jgi:RNA polymerase sigma factor (TIGR02999 family)